MVGNSIDGGDNEAAIQHIMDEYGVGPAAAGHMLTEFQNEYRSNNGTLGTEGGYKYIIFIRPN